MEKSKEFLDILAKLMDETITPGCGSEVGILSTLINDELHTRLGETCYPDSPRIMRRLNTLLSDYEHLRLCDELCGRHSILLAMKNPNKGFAALKGRIEKTDEADLLSDVMTTLPMLVYPALDYKITAVTYAGKRVQLSLEEYQLFIEYTTDNNIAAEKIVVMFIIGCRMKGRSSCFIFDNRELTARHFLANQVDESYLYMPDRSYKPTERFDGTVKKTVEEAPNSLFGTVIAATTFNGILDTPEKYCTSISFYNEFKTISAKIDAFYFREMKYARKMQKAVTSDLARNGSSDNLSDLRAYSASHLKTLKEEQARLAEVTGKIANVFKTVDKGFENRASVFGLPVFPGRTWASMVTQYFIYAEAEMDNAGKAILESLEESEYDNIAILKRYSKGMKGDSSAISRRFEPETMDWINAKLAISVNDVKKLSKAELQIYIDELEKSEYGFGTGKELYAKSFTVPDKQRIELLKRSFEKGFLPAADELMEINKENEKAVPLKYLAEMLHIDACMALSDKLTANATSVNLTSNPVFYYKLAAALEHIPAVKKLADLVYDTNFKTVKAVKSAAKVSLAQGLCSICEYLIEKKADEWRYKAILGVVLYELGDLTGSLAMLQGTTTKEAHYCMGRIYEQGKGALKNEEKAMAEYRAADIFDSKERYDKLAEARSGVPTPEQKSGKKKDKPTKTEKSGKKDDTNPGGADDKKCFITTATCRSLGEGDDCDVLTTIRNYRDTYVKGTPDGELLISEYYRIAPTIVSKINALADSSKEYRKLWESYLRPCDARIKDGKYEEARLIYIDMVMELCRKFSITVDEKLQKAYCK